MQPSERDPFAPNLSSPPTPPPVPAPEEAPPPAPGSPQSSFAPVPPTVFEPAPAPGSVPPPLPPAPQNPPGPPIYYSALGTSHLPPESSAPPLPPRNLPGSSAYSPAFDAPPLPPVVPFPAAPREIFRRIPRWRWMMSLLLIGFYPAFISLLGQMLSHRSKHKGGSALPSSSQDLVRYVTLDLAVFGLFWLLGWAFSRATKDELLLRWRGGAWKPIWQGFAWALGLRLAIMVAFLFVFIVAAIVLSAAGTDPKSFAHLIQKNGPKPDALFPKGALSNPVYLLLSTTLLSFVAAGLREELWRTACLAALRHLLPDAWSDRARWSFAIGLSSVIFGLGHVYQGAVGVVMTGIIGAGLGVLTWRNRSIWPSVWAHGFFDATSFLLAAMVAGRKIPLPAWF